MSSPRRRAAAATPRVAPVSRVQRRVSATAPRAGISADTQRKRARPADLTGCPRHRRLVLDGELRNSLHPHLEGDSQLHPGEVRPDASVDAEAEGGVLVDL